MRNLHAKINTEAADIIMDPISKADGQFYNFDLNLRNGFQLHPGTNSVEIEYQNSYHRPHYGSFLLILPESETRGLPAHPGKIKPLSSKGAKYAVVIGISKYQHGGAGLPNLKYADRDAQAFLDFLKSPRGGGFPEENIQVLLNEKATLQNVHTALRTFLTKPAENDTVVIFLAGHGDEDPNDNRNLYFLTYDTDPDNMGGTALLMSELQDAFQRIIKARRVITFADSCHSFGLSGQRAHVTRKENNLINQYLTKYASAGERAVITASDISEESKEDERWGGGHGVFTYYLLQGLQGSADLDHDGNVTVGELFTYVNAQVLKATGGSQRPRIVNGAAESVALSGPMARERH